MKTTAVGIVVVLLAACGSKPQAPPPRAQTTAATAPSAAAPNDPNLISAPIPALLLEAQRAPYAEPADGTCAGLEAQVVALDAVLGADLDVPSTPANASLIERGAVAPTATPPGAAPVPSRAWVRPRGNERYARDVAAAIAAGAVRRAYLKGIGVVRGCQAPAAPATVERP